MPEVVDKVIEIFKYADGARKPFEQVWKKAWNLYENRYDFSKKNKWQSQGYVPRLRTSVRRASATLRNALLESKDIFVVEGIGTPENKAKGFLLTKIVNFWLNYNNIIALFEEGTKSALLTGLFIFKIYWRKTKELEWGELPYYLAPPEAPKEKGEVKIEIVDPFDFYVDPTGRNKFCIHILKMDLDELISLAEQGQYDSTEVARIQEHYQSPERDWIDQFRKGLGTTTTPSGRREVELMEYWGDLYLGNGEVAKNVTCTVANRKYLIRPPTPNPYIHGKFPFVWASPYKRPFCVYGESMAENVIHLQEGITDLYNAMCDGVKYNLVRGFEIDVDAVADEDDFAEGIVPGKIFKKFGQGRLVTGVDVGGMGQEAIIFYDLLDREFQNHSGITEFMMGLPGGRTRRTATEIEIKVSEAYTLLNDIARSIETNLLEPLLERIYKLVLQYQEDFMDLVDILGFEDAQRLSAMTPAERFQAISGNFKYKARGVTVQLTRMRDIERITQLLAILGRSPLIQVINMPRLLKKLVEALGFDPSEMVFEFFEQPENVPPEVGQAVGQQFVPEQQRGRPPERVPFMGRPEISRTEAEREGGRLGGLGGGD